MAVATEISFTEYAGNESTVTAYPVTWPFIDPAHIKVRVRDYTDPENPGEWVDLGSGDYTVSLWDVPETESGYNPRVNTTDPIDSSQEVYIYRDTPRLQPTIYPTSGTFPAKSHETALDRLTMIIQEIERGVGFGGDTGGGGGGGGEDGEDGEDGLSADNSLHWAHERPVDKTYPVVLNSNKAGLFTGVVTKTVSGTLTANFRLNGVSIGGLGAVEVTSTKTTTPTDPVDGVAFAIGDTIDVVTTSAASPRDFQFSLLA